MAIDGNVIRELLNYLEGEIKDLQDSQISLSSLDTDNLLRDATKYRIQVAIEIVINISEHLVAGLNLGQPEYARDLFPLLEKAQIIDQDLADKLSKAVGLRNILVHQYQKVNLEILVFSATQGLEDLRKFAYAVNRFMEKE